MSTYFEINGVLTLSKEGFEALGNSQIGLWFDTDEGEILCSEVGDDVEVTFLGNFRNLGRVMSSEVNGLLRDHPSIAGEWIEICTDGMTGFWEYEIRDGVLMERYNESGQFYPFGTGHEEVLVLDGDVLMDGYIGERSVIDELRPFIGARVRLVVHKIVHRNEVQVEGFDAIVP